MKKVPQKLIKNIKGYNLAVSNKFAFKEILAGKKEEITLNNKIENNIIVHVGSNAQLVIKEHIDGIIFVLEKNAVVNWFLREENQTKKQKNISAILGTGARFNFISSVTDNVGLNVEIAVFLAGTGASVNIEKAVISEKNAETNYNILINHLARCTESNYFSRTIVDDSAKVSEKVKTIVSREAKKSIAHQRMDSLILSNKAVVSGWPQLEINNNDVVCTHALTTGHLDENEIFYIKSRGINEREAFSMIANGFLKPIENKLSNVNKEIYD